LRFSDDRILLEIVQGRLCPLRRHLATTAGHSPAIVACQA
jgi:hypothetical protein